ncbi:restriction endonuclease [Halobacterium salinarum]|uniref:restriction endonuclease n=1 Tax=Halobacterium salinarum TaxID=2242 RepID=UPI002555278E|nr:restriction endonuclease [Halobacterium salinarum]MDL0130990.1 restriction endonuclease [Halobacterium salinarum]
MKRPSESAIKDHLQRMDPYKFERLVSELWELQGFEVSLRDGSGDRGIDVEALKEDPFSQKILIQAKRYSDDNKVGSNAVRKYATLYQQVDDVDTVVIVTTAPFTQAAERLAQDLGVKTVAGDAVSRLVADYIDEIDTIQITSSDRDTRQGSKSDPDDSSSLQSDHSVKSENESDFPWLNYPRERWSVTCPYCDRKSIHNHPDSFIDHWKEDDHCDGPNARPPSRLTISEDDWNSVLEEVYPKPPEKVDPNQPKKEASRTGKFSQSEGLDDPQCAVCDSGEIIWSDSKSIGECGSCSSEYKCHQKKWYLISQN